MIMSGALLCDWIWASAE